MGLDMKRPHNSVLVVLCSLIVCSQARAAKPLHRVQTIPLRKVKGRIDHLSVDVLGQRLFVSALGNNTVEVIDLHSGKVVKSIDGLKEPQGVLYIPGLNKVFVANGGDGSCRIFTGSSFLRLATIRFSSDADNIRYDPTRKLVYVGYGDGGLGIIDAIKDRRVGEISFRAHPESFQLEKSGRRIFVNVPALREVLVIDAERRTLIATWRVESARGNFPMALDETHHCLFVVCRRPARLLIFKTYSGRVVESLPCVGDADDIFYDATNRRLYISGGEGSLDVFKQDDADHYELIQRLRTAPGARTSLFVQELKRLYLAVPRRGRKGATIRVYEVQP